MFSIFGLTATGIGLFNIAASSTVNTLAAEGKISTGIKKKLGTLLLVANVLPVSLGVATITDSESSTSAGLGQMALGGGFVCSMPGRNGCF